MKSMFTHFIEKRISDLDKEITHMEISIALKKGKMKDLKDRHPELICSTAICANCELFNKTSGACTPHYIERRL